MNSHCCHANSEQRMAQMQRQLELAASIAEIERINANEKAKEKMEKQELHGDIAPAALKKLEANSNDASKLTVKEMDAIAYTYFMNAVLKGKKPEKVRGLQTLIRTHSDVMPRALATITCLRVSSCLRVSTCEQPLHVSLFILRRSHPERVLKDREI